MPNQPTVGPINLPATAKLRPGDLVRITGPGSWEIVEPDPFRSLVSDWQANGNSRPLGDPTAETWQTCARQLLQVVDANGPGL